MNPSQQPPGPPDEGDASIEGLVLAVLNGADCLWPADFDSQAETRFLIRCREEGVAPLVHHRLRHSQFWDGWPDSLRRALTAESAGNELLQTLDLRELAALLEGLNAAGVEALVLKGAALSITHYPKPHLRPREDTDVLVRQEDARLVEQVLIEQGYRKTIAHAGQLIMFQSGFRKDCPNGFSHTFDVHWKISNAQLFARSLSFDELRGKAATFEGPLPPALTPAPTHGLLLACMHRVGHHRNSIRLIWLYDIHLLAEKLTEPEQRDFIRLAREKEMTAVCLDGLRESCARFGGAVVKSLIDALAQSGLHDAGSALLGKQGRLELMLSDLKSVPGLGGKARLALEHLFPPPEYMLRRYCRRSRLTLPFLYVHRIARGLWRLLTK